MKILSNWRSVRLWESELERDLHRDYSLRTHGILIGSAMLLLMWAVSALLMHFGTHSLSARYAFTLGVGYLGYLALLRWWAQRLVQGRTQVNPDAPDPSDFGLEAVGEVASNGSLLSDAASGAFDVAAAADDGAIIVVPVVAIFLIVVAIVFGAGWLTLLYFGWETLLAVAVEVAFSYVSARAVVRVAREGWLVVAVKLTWKPLLGALLCAVLLGATIDHFMPQVHSLPEAVRVLLHNR
jgi:hypothetical protein